MTIFMSIPKKEIKEFHDGLDFLTYLMGKEFANPAKEYYNVTQFNAACNVLHRIRDEAAKEDGEMRDRYNKASKEYHDRLDELRRTWHRKSRQTSNAFCFRPQSGVPDVRYPYWQAFLSS